MKNRKGRDLAPELIPPLALAAVSRLMAKGKKKHRADSWKDIPEGERFTLLIGKILRHTIALASGEIFDEETGEPHSAAVAVNALFITHFIEQGEEEHPCNKQN